MRAQAMENLLILFEMAVAAEDMDTLRNLRVKSMIIRDRGNKSNSVLKELLEKGPQ